MGRLRTETANVQAAGANRFQGRSRPSDFGGSGLAETGKTIAGLGDIFQQRAEQDEMSEVRKTLSSGRAQHTQYMIESAQTMEEGGVGFTEGFSGQLNDWSTQTRSNFKTERALQAFDEGMASMSGDLTTRAIGMQSKAHATKQRQDFTTGLNDDAAVVQTDPSQYNAVREERIAAIADLRVDGNTKAELTQKMDTTLAWATIRGETRIDPATAKARLEAGDWNDVISAGQVKMLIGETNTAINQNKSEAAVQQSLSFSQLTLDILQGKAGRPEAEEFKQNAIVDLAATGQQSVQLERMLQAVEGDQAKAAAMTEAGNLAYNGIVALDPTNRDHQKVVDSHYAQVSRGWETQSPGEVTELNVDYAKRMGVIPSGLVTGVNAGLNSEDPSKVIPAAEMLEKLTSSNTQFVNQFSDQSISFGQQVLDYTRYGLSPQDAVDKAIDVRQVKPDVRESRRGAFQILNKDGDVTSFVQEQIDAGWYEGGVFESDPVVDEVIAGEFNRLAEREYGITGDINIAKNSAFTQLRKTWGVTSVDGRQRFMKNAPEMHYGVPGMSDADNAAWMQDQLVGDLSRGAITSETFGENLILSVHPTNVDKTTGKPLYAVSTVTADGTIQMLDIGEGWKPDYSATPAFADQVAEKEADYAAGRQDAEQLRLARIHAAETRAGTAATLFPPKAGAN